MAASMPAFGVELIEIIFKHFSACLEDHEYNECLVNFARYHNIFLLTTDLVKDFPPFASVWHMYNTRVQHIFLHTMSNREILLSMFDELDTLFYSTMDDIRDMMTQHDERTMAVVTYSYNGSCGVFFGCSETFGAACVSICLQVLWVSLWSVLIFMSLKKLDLLRISKEEEERGLDVSKHGGSAYAS